uniref:SAYSvFN domain-containing protein n=1 Tax=Mucochytrium quahogii TaxID=96639 RepID=A0A7S2WSL2_9STRA|mmetsp:Transcript_1311/g.2054  ORF Transcript_1311/g.2054 Transcript_1311/m.2054 type:complete len:151 (+) Transcript_1311:1867-2319(+)|eukprot:CAMPEP_0203771844 /NCGR_PEP_ID=MMETSP0099_2-20121227/3658_1 /ASSEMBLY_ACC=CAM_ASM_000209 /TAXON_ID=96639 /ORGANISM=" , Strain NY0313808BC1" /LENGTH=150 /DNA_ID=CAMNT_0050669269 /DNA_START=479 /DNA_END=931 /DNA_ORIENTATION=-
MEDVSLPAWSWNDLLKSKYTWYVVAWWVVARLLLAYTGEQGGHMLFVFLTLFYLIFTNLGERKDGSLSAYSVFNKGFKKLPGTFTAEEFDQQMRSGGNQPSNEQDYYEDDEDDEERRLREEEEEMINIAIARSLQDVKPKQRGKKKKGRK